MSAAISLIKLGVAPQVSSECGSLVGSVSEHAQRPDESLKLRAVRAMGTRCSDPTLQLTHISGPGVGYDITSPLNTITLRQRTARLVSV